MYLIIVIMCFVVSKVSCNFELDEVSAIHCPPGWVAQSQSWYANTGNFPKVDANVITSSISWFKEDGNMNDLTQNANLTYKICVVCVAMNDHPQKLIEVCATKFISKTSNASWHYERQECNKTSTPPSHVNWCSPATVCGLSFKHYMTNLISTLMSITPIFCRESKIHTKKQYTVEDLSLKCPKSMTLTRLEVQNTMCANDTKDSFCIVCSSNKIEMSICAPQNCSEIDKRLDYKTITQKIYQPNQLINNNSNESNDCGFLLSYSKQENSKNLKVNDPQMLIYCQLKVEAPCSIEHSTKVIIITLSTCLVIMLVLLVFSTVRPSKQYKHEKNKKSVYLMSSDNPYYNETNDAEEPYDIPTYNEEESRDPTQEPLQQPFNIPKYNEDKTRDSAYDIVHEPYDIPTYDEQEAQDLSQDNLHDPYNMSTTGDPTGDPLNEPYSIPRIDKQEAQDASHNTLCEPYNILTLDEHEARDPTLDTMHDPYDIPT